MPDRSLDGDRQLVQVDASVAQPSALGGAYASAVEECEQSAITKTDDSIGLRFRQQPRHLFGRKGNRELARNGLDRGKTGKRVVVVIQLAPGDRRGVAAAQGVDRAVHRRVAV